MELVMTGSVRMTRYVMLVSVEATSPEMARKRVGFHLESAPGNARIESQPTQNTAALLGAFHSPTATNQEDPQ